MLIRTFASAIRHSISGGSGHEIYVFDFPSCGRDDSLFIYLRRDVNALHVYAHFEGDGLVRVTFGKPTLERKHYSKS